MKSCDCICKDCRKIGCKKLTVRYAYQRCMFCIQHDGTPVHRCSGFQTPPPAPPVEIKIKKRASLNDQLELILAKLAQLEDELSKR